MWLEFFQDFSFGDGRFVTALGVLGQTLDFLLDAFEIGHDELGRDGLDVADGINGTGDVMDVFVFEAANDLDDGVDFADVSEEFVAKTFALGGAFNESGNVNEFDSGRNDDLGLGDLRQDFEAGIGDGDDADVWIDGAEGVIGGLGLARACDGVKQGRFAHIRQANNSSFQHKEREP